MENLCPRSTYTGWDADGGFARYTTVPQDFAYRLDADRAPEELAPFLCAGIIGYRALVRANLPPVGRLGLYGFGSSAHLSARLPVAAHTTVVPFERIDRALSDLAHSRGSGSLVAAVS